MALKFAALPTLPASITPTADGHAAHKKYVDDAKLGTFVDCSRMTTAAAINAAATAAGAGATIWLGARPTGFELTIEDTLVFHPHQHWVGAGGRSLATRVIAGASFTAGKPLMAAVGYMTNAGDADEGVVVEGISLDCNSKLNSHGLVVYNFWSRFEDVQVFNCNTGHAFHVTDRAINTTTISSNSHSENQFVGLRVDDTTNLGMGFYSESVNGISNQDGHLRHSYFAGCSGQSIYIGRAAGWTIEDNHLYGCGDDGIVALLCYGTKICNNYVEDFGVNNVTTGPSNGYYSGITMSILDGKPSLCYGNTVSLDTPAVPAYNRASCIAVRPNSTQLKARVGVIGNIVAMSDPTPVATNAEAFRIGEVGDTGRVLTVTFSGNQIGSRGEFPSQIFRSNSSTRMTKDPVGVRSYTGVTTTHVLDNEFEMVQNFTVTGNVEIDPPATNVFARDGEPFQLRFLASGGARTVTFDASMRTSTGVTRGPHSIPSGEVLFAMVEWSSLVNDYTITAVTVSAN